MSFHWSDPPITLDNSHDPPYSPLDVIIYCLFCFFLFLFVCLFFAFFSGEGAQKKKKHDKAKKKEGKYEERSKNQWKEDPEERLMQSAIGRQLLGNLTSIDVAEQIFGSVEENDRDTPVDSISMLSLLLRN